MGLQFSGDTWRWLDTGAIGSFNNSGTADGDCVVVRFHGGPEYLGSWHEEPCDEEEGVVCEKAPDICK